MKKKKAVNKMKSNPEKISEEIKEENKEIIDEKPPNSLPELNENNGLNENNELNELDNQLKLIDL